MVEIRWHGRGGQRAFTADRLLGVAVTLFEDRYALAFPSFGPERRGSPVLGFTRMDERKIADRGAPRKQEIAFAQTCFAVQTRRAELIEQRLLEAERVHARHKLSATEKELSSVIFEQTGGTENFAVIRSKGDHALFGKSTQAMKAEWDVPDKRPLADFAPTIILKAKDFATEITIFNAREHRMKSEGVISIEHITNNEAVRNTLLERGICPESLLPRRLASEEKRSLKNPDGLSEPTEE